MTTTPFVARQEELDFLGCALKRAHAGQGQVVAVVGEPGVGKSRLLAEFSRICRAEGWRVLASEALPGGRDSGDGIAPMTAFMFPPLRGLGHGPRERPTAGCHGYRRARRPPRRAGGPSPRYRRSLRPMDGGGAARGLRARGTPPGSGDPSDGKGPCTMSEYDRSEPEE